MTSAEPALARRYLLGAASEQECAVIEQEYLQHEEALERIAAAEDDLIEDYLEGRLGAVDRERFERWYLSTPTHRARVETIRRLMAHPRGPAVAAPRVVAFRPRPRLGRAGRWLAAAASLVLVAALGFWRFLAVDAPPAGPGQAEAPPALPATQQPAPAPSAPRTFAITVSPLGVRGATGDDAVVVPPGTDVLIVDLEREIDGGVLAATRASIRAVGGDEVWGGAVTGGADLSPGTSARIEVPAARLAADDYVLTLYGRDPRGVEREWARYVLRIRTR